MNIAIFGCGSVCEKYILGLRANPNVRIIGFYDAIKERADEKAAQENCLAYKSEEDAFNSPDVDLVINITPPNQHFDINKRALEAGKHVFSEKPLTLTATEAFELYAMAKKHGAILMSAPDTFLGEPFQQAQRILNAGGIGKPTSFAAALVGPGHEAWHPQPDYYYKKGAGPLWDMGPYFLTQLVHMFGPIKDIAAIGSTPQLIRHYTNAAQEPKSIDVEVPTHYDIILKTQSAVSGTFTVSYDVIADRRPYFDVFGTEGVLHLENPDEYQGRIGIVDKSGATTHMECPETRLPPRARALGIIDLYNSIAQGIQPATAGYLGPHVIEVLESIERSVATGTWIKLDRSLI